MYELMGFQVEQLDWVVKYYCFVVLVFGLKVAAQVGVVFVYSADRHRIDIARNKYYNTSSTSVDPCPFNGLVLTAQ
jgi:hypothetical protein